MTTLIIKDWLLNKKSQELETHLKHNRIFAVLKETEKAYYVMYSLSAGRSKCFWVPKSAVETEETENEHHETKYIEDYNQALQSFKDMWAHYI